jgi:hypothetical protein
MMETEEDAARIARTEEERARQEMITRLAEILTKHKLTEGVSVREQREDAIRLMHAGATDVLYGSRIGSGDRAGLEKLDGQIRGALRTVEALTEAAQAVVDRQFCRAEIGDGWCLEDVNLLPSASSALEVVLESVQRTLKFEDAEGPGPGKVDWRATAVVMACRRLWKSRTGKDAPMNVNQGTARLVPFSDFAEAVLKALGSRTTRVDSALRNARRLSAESREPRD